MLEQITWSGYWTTIGAMTAIYYAGIGFLFYRKKIITAFNRKPPRTNNYPGRTPDNVMGAILSESDTREGSEEEPMGANTEESAEIPIKDTPENIRTLDKTTETGDLISEALSALGVNTNSQELVTTIVAIIQKQNINGTLTPFREALDWHINQTALDSCGISLDKEELDAIWKGAAEV